MSVQAISWAIDNSKHKGSTLLLLIMIANHAHADGSGAYPSIPTLAKETRLSERGVQYCLEELRKSGEIAIFPNTGPRGANLYHVNMTQSLRHAEIAPVQSARALTQKTASLDAIAIAPEPKNRKEPSLACLIEQSIQESYKTGEQADAILARLRAGAFEEAQRSER